MSFADSLDINEQWLFTQVRILEQVLVKFGWMMYNVLVQRARCLRVVIEDGEGITAVTVKMRELLVKITPYIVSNNLVNSIQSIMNLSLKRLALFVLYLNNTPDSISG